MKRNFILLVTLTALFSGCKPKGPDLLQGYVEGEYLYIASPLPGALEKLSVLRGDQVKTGDPLFTLESGLEKAAQAEAERRLLQARANLEDAKKGRRPTEIASLDAQLQQARSAADLADKESQRQQQLVATGATSTENADRARSTALQSQARLAQTEADLATGRLGARPDQIAAAEAAVRIAEAGVDQANWNLRQKQQSAPQSGQVFDTLYRQGEWIVAGRPIVVLLPPQNIKVRFFIPQTQLGRIKQGAPITVHVDGMPTPFPGKISFISPQAEYTPPVIYSNDNRAKLVFMTEATFPPETAAGLHPGQPVDVHLD